MFLSFHINNKCVILSTFLFYPTRDGDDNDRVNGEDEDKSEEGWTTMNKSSRRTRRSPITINCGQRASSIEDDECDECDLDENLEFKEAQEEAGKEQDDNHQ